MRCFALAFLALAAALVADERQDRLRATVESLCSAKLEGRVRGTDGAKRSAEVIAKAFEAAGLRPFEREGYIDTFPITGQAGAAKSGHNVLGWLPGKPGQPLIVLGAHFDGPGYVNGHLTPGADHNASGIAAMVELARFLASQPGEREFGVLFAAFDDGLGEARLGSARLAKQLGRERTRAMFCLEMLGGDPTPAFTQEFFALGVESSPAWEAAIEAYQGDLTVAQGGIYLVEGLGPRGDYDAFRSLEVPFLYVSTGVTRHLDKPTDTPETLNYAKMAGICDFLASAVAALEKGAAPSFSKAEGNPSTEEVKRVLSLVERVLAARAELNYSENTREALETRAKKLAKLLEKGEIPAGKRDYLQKTLEFVVIVIVQPS